MKRISIFAVVVLLAVASIAEAYGQYRGPLRRQVRWSVYAHGLVPNELYYSPYAHTYGHSGLVPYWVRYSPYAHSYDHPSGLVDDYAWSAGSVYYRPADFVYVGSCRVDYNRGYAVGDSSDGGYDTKQTRASRMAKMNARREQLKQLALAREDRRRANLSQGKETIAAYLKSRNIDFRTNRMLLIEGKVLSVDFILGDGATVISYWDPVEIQALGGQAEYRTLLYQNHVKAWQDFCMEHQRAGGRIVQIVSTDRGEILAKLVLCDKLGEAQKAYAMAPTPPQP